MSSNSVCNHTRFHSYDYKLNWTPLSSITITNSTFGHDKYEKLKELPLACRMESESTLLFAIHFIYGLVRMKLIWITVTISFLL